jgi:hypothetical protein
VGFPFPIATRAATAPACSALPLHAKPRGQVEFVLSTMDRVQLGAALRGPDALPFALSFATSPGFLDVAVPDPSFWAWPEMLIAPYWEVPFIPLA